MYFVHFAINGSAMLSKVKCKQIYEELNPKPWWVKEGLVVSALNSVDKKALGLESVHNT